MKILSTSAWPGVTRPSSKAEDGKCALCGVGWSVFHGVYECSAIEHHRRTAASPELRAAAAAAKAADAARGELFARGLLPHPGALLPPAKAEAGICWFNRPPGGLLTGALFTDGSVSGVTLGAPRAGWAVVRCDPAGELISAAFGAVPLMEAPGQTIADAEDYAVAMLGVLALPPFVAHVDRQQTVDDALGSRAAATSASHPRAHLWVRFSAAFEQDVEARVVKTKGHATAADVAAAKSTAAQMCGNDHADRFARLGVQQHGPDAEPEGAQAATLDAMAGLARQAVRWSAEASVHRQALLPPPTATGVKRRGTGDGWPPRKRRATAHLRRSALQPGAGPGGRTEWRLGSAGLAAVDDRPSFQGHSLQIARVRDELQAHGALVFCATCGAYVWWRIGSLTAACRGKAIGSQRKRLRDGHFPQAVQPYASWHLTNVRSPTPQEVVQLGLQITAAAELQRHDGVGPAVPRRRLRKKTDMAGGDREECRWLLEGFGLGGAGALDRLVAASVDGADSSLGGRRGRSGRCDDRLGAAPPPSSGEEDWPV